MKSLLTKILPSRIRRRIRSVLISTLGITLKQQLTIAQGWEQYAQRYKGKKSEHLGDEWNDPEGMGIDASFSVDQIVSYLDQKVFAPFLGRPNIILEIGSGGGRFTEILLQKCNKLIATDTSPTMLELLQERFQDNNKIDCMLLNGLGLSPIPDSSIDAGFSYGVFVHLQHWDIFNYLSELGRVLKPGGKAIVHHANTFSELGWKLFLKNVRPSLNKHKLPWTFTVMTPEIMREFALRTGLILEDCLTDIVRRDCISLIRKPEP